MYVPPLSEVNKFNQSNKFTAYIAPYVASISEAEMPKVVDWLAELLTLSTEVHYNLYIKLTLVVNSYSGY